MGSVLDALFGLIAGADPAGRRRPRRPRRFEPVVETPWLPVAAAALAVALVPLAAASLALVIGALALAGDDLLGILGIIALPFAAMGAAMMLSAVGWAVPVIRRAARGDGSCRGELLAAGVGGVLLGSMTALATGWPVPLVLALPAAVVAAIAIAPSPWEPRHTVDAMRSAR